LNFNNSDVITAGEVRVNEVLGVEQPVSCLSVNHFVSLNGTSADSTAIYLGNDVLPPQLSTLTIAPAFSS
jgi:hypothetical protein